MTVKDNGDRLIGFLKIERAMVVLFTVGIVPSGVELVTHETTTLTGCDGRRLRPGGNTAVVTDEVTVPHDVILVGTNPDDVVRG